MSQDNKIVTAARFGRAVWIGQCFCTRLRLLFWRVVTFGTTPGRARSLLRAWPAWGHIYFRIRPTVKIPGAPFGLGRLRFETYRGEPLVLPDGTPIRAGVKVIEFHLDSAALLKVIRAGHDPLPVAYDEGRRLAAWMAADESFDSVRAFYGVTLLGRWATRFGFWVRPRPATIRNRILKLFLTGLMLLYSRDGMERLRSGSIAARDLCEVWISRGELLRLYASREGIDASATGTSRSGAR